MTSILNDAADGKVIRAQLHVAREKVDEVFSEIDSRISNVVTAAVEATKVRTVPVHEMESLSAERMIREAKEGTLMQSRINDIGSLRAKLHNKVEENVGGIGRLVLHSTMAMNEWWMNPVEDVIDRVSAPIVTFVDNRIKGVTETIEESLDEDTGHISPGKLASSTLDSVVQLAHDVWSWRGGSQTVYDLVFADVIAYANHFMNEARDVVDRQGVNSKLKSAVEAAEKKLKALQSKLNANQIAIRDQIEKNIYKAVDYSKNAKTMTKELTKATFKKTAKAYGQTKKIIESTLSYVHMTKTTMIPNDVKEFCHQMLVNDEDRSPQFKKTIGELEELLTLMIDVFNLKKEAEKSKSRNANAAHVAA